MRHYIIRMSLSTWMIFLSVSVYADTSKKVDAQMCEKSRECFYDIIKIDDFNHIVAKDNYGRHITIVLAGVLPYSRWPVSTKSSTEQLIASGRKFIEGLVKHNKVLLKPLKPITPDQKVSSGYLYFYSNSLSKQYNAWEGKRPSEHTSWGGFNLNAMLLENGYTVTTYKQDMFPVIPGNLGTGAIERSLLAAEEYAKKNQSGLWNNSKLSAEIKAINIQ